MLLASRSPWVLLGLLVLAPAAAAQPLLSWGPIDHPFTEIIEYVVPAPDGRVLVAARLHDGVYAYDHADGSWTPLGFDGAGTLIDDLTVDADGVFHLIYQSYAPFGPDRYFRSADGVTWEHVHTFPTSSSIEDLGLGHGDVVLAGGFSQGFYSPDGGTTWTPSIPSHAQGFLPLADGTIIASVSSLEPTVKLIRSFDNGATWFNFVFTEWISEEMVQTPASTLLAAAFSAGVMRSTNGGIRWSQTPLVDYATDLLLLGGGAVLAGTHEGLFLTDDDGQTWVPYGLDGAVVRDIARGADGAVYVVTGSQNPTDTRFFRGEPAVAVRAVPVSPPVVIPAGGGAFDFALTLTNTTTQPQTFQAWTAVTGPVNRGPVLGPRTVTLPPGQTLTRTLTQRVPGIAPAGTYTYAVNLGTSGGGVITADAFTFTKEGSTPATRGRASEAAWPVSGWDGAPAASAAVPGEVTLFGVSPNPFTGRATIRFALPMASAVRVVVYDVLGREVAVLVDGRRAAGAHEAVLNGSSLPSGTYLVRLEAGGQARIRRVSLLR